MAQNASGQALQSDRENKKDRSFPIHWTRRTSLDVGALALIIIAGAFLRLYKMGASGVGKTYSAAAVKLMPTTWRNFSFITLESGDWITMDKFLQVF